MRAYSPAPAAALMVALAAVLLDGPADDVEQGRATPGLEPEVEIAPLPRLVRIHNSTSKPPGAFVVVPFRDGWFWIEENDLKSKRASAFMLMLFTLAETGEKESLPLITIPA